jgi:Eco57I restriction-modification methylase
MFPETVAASRRKTDGIFYTPDHIVRYIVDRTLGAYLREHEAKFGRQDYRSYQAFLRTVKVLDPACGSGAFLTHVLDVLLAEHQRVGAVLHDSVPAGEYARQILRRSIYGVDLSEESVQITKQILSLKSGITDDKPAGLDGTIKCGNSLIEDPAFAGPRAFSWPGQFPEVMAAGGFDIVVGNPPYVNARTINKADKTYLREHYPQLRGAYDLYVAFLLRGRQLLNEQGRYGWIVPNKFLVADYARPARDFLANDSLTRVVDVSTDEVFRRIGVYPVILFGQRGSTGGGVEITARAPVPAPVPVPGRSWPTLADRGFQLNAGTTGFAAQAIKGLLNEDNRGIPFAVSGSINRYELDTSSVRYMKDRYTHPHVELDSPIVAASKYRFWQAPKIVIAGLTRRIEAVYVDRPLALGVGAYGIYHLAGYEPYAVTAVLNSAFMSSYLRAAFHGKQLAGGYLAINKSTIEQLPMPDRAALEDTELTDLSKRLHEPRGTAETERTEQRIDQIVHDLFASRLPMRSRARRENVLCADGQPQLGQVLHLPQVPPGQRLDLADPVQHRVPVHAQLTRGGRDVPVMLQQHPQ